MGDVSVCFPYRSDGGERDRVADWVTKRWKWIYPEFELIRGECDTENFSRSQAINNAVRQSHGETLIIADLDNIFHKDFIESALSREGWGFPYRGYFNLTWHSSEWVLGSPPGMIVPLEDVRFGRWGNENVSGLIVIKAEDFKSVGMFDEGFIGWGFEDLAFAREATRILGDPFRVEEGYVLHLWHPSPDMSMSAKNKARFEG